MDNEQLRATLGALNPTRCPFEQAILTHRWNCSQAERWCIAERQGVLCRSKTARDPCLRLLGVLRQQARFALGHRDSATALSHARGTRLQVGGLRGLASALAAELPLERAMADVLGLVQRAEACYPDLAELPLEPIIREIAAFRSRIPFRQRHAR